MRLRTGKLVEHWRVGDDLGQLQQLGLLPSPGHGRPEEKLSAP